jgi:hypothetical protein
MELGETRKKLEEVGKSNCSAKKTMRSNSRRELLAVGCWRMDDGGWGRSWKVKRTQGSWGK